MKRPAARPIRHVLNDQRRRADPRRRHGQREPAASARPPGPEAGTGRRAERLAASPTWPSRATESQPAALVGRLREPGQRRRRPCSSCTSWRASKPPSKVRTTPPHSEHWRRGMSRNSIGIRPPDYSVAPPAPAGRADDERDPKPRRQAVTTPLERLVGLIVVFLPASHGGPHGTDESPDSDHPLNIHELFTSAGGASCRSGAGPQ